jgi:hypothetical protein
MDVTKLVKAVQRGIITLEEIAADHGAEVAKAVEAAMK